MPKAADKEQMRKRVELTYPKILSRYFTLISSEPSAFQCVNGLYSCLLQLRRRPWESTKCSSSGALWWWVWLLGRLFRPRSDVLIIYVVLLLLLSYPTYVLGASSHRWLRFELSFNKRIADDGCSLVYYAIFSFVWNCASNIPRRWFL